MSNIDHAISYNVELPTVQVGLDGMYSDHLPLSVTIPCTVNTYPPKPKPKLGSDWEKVSCPLFQQKCDEVLGKIKIPFHLLQWNADLPDSEIRLQLNLYFAEICHTLKIAESQAVPSVELRRTSRVKGWAQNSDLVNAKAAATFWLQI